jgi:riboflavin kinase/FMN adenylyltransferase
MEVVIGPEHCIAPVRGSAVTIGAYDGVHNGHRHLINALRSMAHDGDLDTVVVTFDRHPATVVRPESAPPLLTDLEQKLELLGVTGIDRTVVVPFDEVRANETAEDFVVEVLVEALGAKLVVVGEDFHFGHGRKGNVALLAEMGLRYGFEVVGLGLEADGAGEPVSSTRIRRLLAAGDVAGAARLLGRHHQVRGTVVRGDGRGGPELGYPTANLDVPLELALPGEGIYACWYERSDGSVHGACASIGHRPTFYPRGGPLLLEAFLLDFDGDLYGEQARLSFVDHLRDDRSYADVDELIAQMALDVGAARAVLDSASP